MSLDSRPWLGECQRLAELQREQVASGKPLILCGYCRGSTRLECHGPQHVLCECCGAQMTLTARDDGGVVLHPICPGPPINRRAT